MLSLYEILKASKTGIAPDMWTALAGANFGGAGSGAETKEITGIPPLSIRSNGTMLLDYLISGNMSQTGTPTSSDPIQPSECGERTGNLFDKNAKNVNNGYISGYYLYPDGTAIRPSSSLVWNTSEYIEITSGYITLSTLSTTSSGTPAICFYDSSKNYIIGYSYDNGEVRIRSVPSGAKYCRISIDERVINQLMLNSGSTALPYEPYGYKIPISSGGNNLFDKSTAVIGERVLQNSVTADAGEARSDYIDVTGIGTLTVNKKYVATNFYFYADKTNTSIGYVNGFTADIPTGAKYCRINVLKDDVDTIMLNRGSTAIPYEPYNRTTTPVYLGEVETTRKIKKVVFTGSADETWNGDSLDNKMRYYPTPMITNGVPLTEAISTHFAFGGFNANSGANGTITGTNSSSAYRMYFWSSDYATVDAWKSYLAQQYANGTPVTVWYVLAEPTTGTVNEPLRKIGDHADTISYEQAGVQIPTNRGNTVIDVLTELKPSEMYIKYKG